MTQGTHIDWLIDTGETIQIACGKKTPIFKFNHDLGDESVMKEWATYFRKHYCSDLDLKAMVPAGQTNKEYLINVKLPSTTGFGPGIRSGDFTEILVSDYLEFLRSYYVPRTRYDRKTIRDESTKGSDLTAFKLDSDIPGLKDELLIYEVKGVLSEDKSKNVLQDAIDHSSKDKVRIAESLNAIKQRLFDRQDLTGANLVKRFQNSVDHPYTLSYGAAAIMSDTSFSKDVLLNSDSTDHVSRDNLELLVITGKELMLLVHALYERAADEA
jgi:hypothetical protein